MAVSGSDNEHGRVDALTVAARMRTHDCQSVSVIPEY